MVGFKRAIVSVTVLLTASSFATKSSEKSYNFLSKCKALNGLKENLPRHVLDFEDIAGSKSTTKRCLLNVSCVIPSKKVDFHTTYLCSVKPSGKCETLDECMQSMKTQTWEAFVDANSASPAADPMRQFGRKCTNQAKGDFVIEGEHKAPDQDKSGVCFKELKCTDANGVEEHLPQVVCPADPVTLSQGKKGTCPSNEECWSKRYDLRTEDAHVAKLAGRRTGTGGNTVARSSNLPGTPTTSSPRQGARSTTGSASHGKTDTP